MGVGIRTAKLRHYLKQYRAAANLKQNELGRLLGHKTGAVVNAWEAGSRVPTLELAAEAAAQLGVSTSQLLGEAERPQPGTHVTNNVGNGDHHTVYQHVEGALVLIETVRQVVREELAVSREQLVEEIRQVLREAAREADDAGEQAQED